MKHLSWIITVPLLAIAVIFAVNHRARVTIDLWPLPMQVEPPMYLLVLVAIFVGFLLGGVVVWWSQGRHRRRARERRHRIEDLEREVTQLRRRMEKAESDLDKARGEAAMKPAEPPRQTLLTSRTGT